MSATATTFLYPAYEDLVRQLVEAHKGLPNERLMLAIYYAPERDPQDVFVFEVLEHFGANAIDDGQELLEATYPSSPNFLLAGNQLLHLVLTSPDEFKAAVMGRWRHINELLSAIDAKRFVVLHKEGTVGQELGAMLGVCDLTPKN